MCKKFLFDFQKKIKYFLWKLGGCSNIRKFKAHSHIAQKGIRNFNNAKGIGSF